jgi:putative ABC transport system permease protein
MLTIRLFLRQLLSAFNELRYNKLRTFLSVLGISIGIFCIIAVLTMIDSFKKNLDDSLSDLGNDVVYVNKFAWMPEPGEQEYPWWKYKSRPQAKYKEMKRLKATTPCIVNASMLYSDRSDASYLDNKIESVTINAVNYEFNQLQKFDIAQGRYFTKSEMEGISNSVLLGSSVVEELFGKGNPLGKTIKLLGRQFKVIGTLAERGKDVTGFQLDNSALVSYRYIQSFKNTEDDLDEFNDNTLMLKVRKDFPMQDALYEIKGSLRAQRRLSPSEKEDFSLNVLSSIQESLDGIFLTVDAAGFLIGFFSLLVGAFGIANIMFVTVKERTAQIGLKKAIGAKPKVILVEFLLESIMLCLLGGLIGIGMVLLAAYFINASGEFEVFFSMRNFILGVSISAIVGVLAGYIPAKRASQLNPITAIRS